MYTLKIKTRQPTEWIEITHTIQALIDEANITEGECLLFVPHTTAAVTINENADPDVTRDMTLGLNEVFYEKAAFKHAEKNSHAHIKSSLIGVDQMILIENGRLVLGTWQGIYFCEFDGPRHRQLHVRLRGSS